MKGISLLLLWEHVGSTGIVREAWTGLFRIESVKVSLLAQLIKTFSFFNISKLIVKKSKPALCISFDTQSLSGGEFESNLNWKFGNLIIFEERVKT